MLIVYTLLSSHEGAFVVLYVLAWCSAIYEATRRAVSPVVHGRRWPIASQAPTGSQRGNFGGRMSANLTATIAALTARIDQLERNTFQDSSANSWWLLSNGILCAHETRPPHAPQERARALLSPHIRLFFPASLRVRAQGLLHAVWLWHVGGWIRHSTPDNKHPAQELVRRVDLGGGVVQRGLRPRLRWRQPIPGRRRPSELRRHRDHALLRHEDARGGCRGLLVAQ